MEVLTDRENSHAYDLAAESPEDTGVSGRKKCSVCTGTAGRGGSKKAFLRLSVLRSRIRSTRFRPARITIKKKGPGLENTGP